MQMNIPNRIVPMTRGTSLLILGALALTFVQAARDEVDEAWERRIERLNEGGRRAAHRERIRGNDERSAYPVLIDPAAFGLDSQNESWGLKHGRNLSNIWKFPTDCNRSSLVKERGRRRMQPYETLFVVTRLGKDIDSNGDAIDYLEFKSLEDGKLY